MVSHFQFLTAGGPAAISLVRISGDAVIHFGANHLRFLREISIEQLPVGAVERCYLLDSDAEVLDDAVLSIHRSSPRWDVRLHLHGGSGLRLRCGELLRSIGFEEAASAAAWVTSDLFEAEMLQRLPSILTETGVCWLLRQPQRLRTALAAIASEEDLETARVRCQELVERACWVEWFSEPLRIAIAGPPNAGKSTLVNALTERSVSLVSPRVGTTRDWVSASGEIAGFPVEWLDTAGLFEAEDALDAAGVTQTREVLASADIVALAVPLNEPGHVVRDSLRVLGREPNVLVRTCADLSRTPTADSSDNEMPVAVVSALENQGLAQFSEMLLATSSRACFAPSEPAPISSSMAANIKKCTQVDSIKELKALLANLE